MVEVMRDNIEEYDVRELVRIMVAVCSMKHQSSRLTVYAVGVDEIVVDRGFGSHNIKPVPSPVPRSTFERKLPPECTRRAGPVQRRLCVGRTAECLPVCFERLDGLRQTWRQHFSRLDRLCLAPVERNVFQIGNMKGILDLCISNPVDLVDEDEMRPHCRCIALADCLNRCSTEGGHFHVQKPRRTIINRFGHVRKPLPKQCDELGMVNLRGHSDAQRKTHCCGRPHDRPSSGELPQDCTRRAGAVQRGLVCTHSSQQVLTRSRQCIQVVSTQWRNQTGFESGHDLEHRVLLGCIIQRKWLLAMVPPRKAFEQDQRCL
jgi:hypothetical protein